MPDFFTINEQERLAYLQALGVEVWLDNSSSDILADVPPDTVVDDQISEPLQNSASSKIEQKPVVEQRVTIPLPEDLDQLAKQVAKCENCSLHKTRTQTVFGVGHQKANWLIVGEAPGADEDKQGEPFVGRAGQLLTQMLRAIGLAREEVFIANILKCRPPNNRDPNAEEITECQQYLAQQIKLIEPKIILVVGRIAAQSLLQNKTAIGKMRGQLYQYGEQQIPVVVT